jgi:hypothetical protein
MEDNDTFDDPTCTCLAFLLQTQATLFMAMDFLLLCYPHVTTTRRASDLHCDAIRTSFLPSSNILGREAFFFVQIEYHSPLILK